jgi:hypothetical protein
MTSDAQPLPTRLLIVGCARSGTGYVSGLLTEAGLDIGHERVFSIPDGLTPGPAGQPCHDVSWLAAPILSELGSEWHIRHQVRDPRAVVSSTLAINLFLDRQSQGSYSEFAFDHTNRINAEVNPIDRGFRYWVEWNKLIESHLGSDGQAPSRHRVEDLDGSWISGVFKSVGLGAPDQVKVGVALAAVPHNRNHRGAGPKIELGDIKNLELAEETRYLAKKYGYAI